MSAPKEVDWLDRAFRRDRSMWWRIGGLLEKAALDHAARAIQAHYDGDRALLLAEAAAYANYMATGEGDWTTRAKLFRRREDEATS